MQKQQLLLKTISLLLATYSMSILAESENIWYVGAESGFQTVDPVGNLSIDGHLYQSIIGGKRVNHFLNLQAEVFSTLAADFHVDALNVSIKPYYALDENWEMFGKASLMTYQSEFQGIQDYYFSSGIGVGISRKINRNWWVNGAINSYVKVGGDDLPEVDLLSVGIGIEYRFYEQPKRDVYIEKPVIIRMVPIEKRIEVVFANDSDEIKNQELLKIISAFDGNDKNIQDISVYGYTNSLGSNRYNMKLSEKRANRVVEAIRSLSGFEQQDISFKSLGESVLKYDESQKEGEIKNRRAEVIYVEFVEN